MRVLVLDQIAVGLDFALRAQNAGHEVVLWMPMLSTGDMNPAGMGMVKKVANWQKWMGWADLIVMTDNAKYKAELAPYFRRGYPIFGANAEAAELELDRKVGQEALEDSGIETVPYEEFTKVDDAIAYVKKNPGGYVGKGWGGTTDKDQVFVAHEFDDVLYNLEQWKEKGMKDPFILQEAVEGVEMAVGGWFGPGGWSEWICENWEEKRLMNDGLGPNTGEMGTVVRYTKKSALFDRVLKPATDLLASLNYVGYVDMNCIIKPTGVPAPLEWTIRFGWPTHCIQMALHRGDPVEWMHDLWDGRNTLQCSKDVAVGIAMCTGDFPYRKMKHEELLGIPLRGITMENSDNLHFLEVMDGHAPVGPLGKDQPCLVTAGWDVLVVTGTGSRIRDAMTSALETCWEVKWPRTRIFRTDIGKRLKKELPKIQEHGYATDLTY